MITDVEDEYGPRARDRLAEAGSPDVKGARAALESFYYAFNHRDLDVLEWVWIRDPLVQLNNPLGGMLRGADEVVALYRRVFNSHARVEVSFGEIVEYRTTGMVVFAGREAGQFTEPGGRNVPLRIRTTVFANDQTARVGGARWTTMAPSTTPTRSATIGAPSRKGVED